MGDRRAGRRYRTDGLPRVDVRWRIAVGLAGSLDRAAAERGVPVSALAEDALAYGLAALQVDRAIDLHTPGTL
jgi:hypothetical protein